MQDITILNTSIRQDAEGRYSLNDLHKAAGGDKRHQPANFLRADGVQAFIEVLDATPQNRGVLASWAILRVGGSSGFRHSP